MIAKIFLRCDEAHVLSTRDQYRDLNSKETFRLKLHTSHCPGCRDFDKTNNYFSKKMHRLKWLRLSEDQKSSIKDRLISAMKG
jgi:alpha-D-ribose 1-methylphosphonate 5-triphosphate diphosphatase PhnM